MFRLVIIRKPRRPLWIDVRSIIVFLLIAAWIFSGWPMIWQNPPIPPKIQKAQAAATYSTDCDGTIQTAASAVAISGCNVGTGLTDGILIISVFGDDGGGTHGAPTVTRGTGSVCGTGTETATIIDTEVSNGSASVSTHRLLDASFAEGSADVCVSWASSNPPDEWSAHLTVFTGVDQTTFTSATNSATFGNVTAVTGTVTIAANEHGYQANACNNNSAVTTLNADDVQRFVLTTGGADKSTSHVSTQTVTGSPATMGVDLYSKSCGAAAMKLITLNDAAAATVSVSVSDGTVTYGTIVESGTASTSSDGLNDSQTATNDGDVTENFNIKGQNSACPWTLAATIGTDQYVHEFCTANCDTTPTWTALTTSYQTLATGIAVSGTQVFDLKVIVPSTSACFTQQSVDVTVQAVQQ